MISAKPSGRESVLLVGIFCVVLAVHVYCTSINFRVGFLIGHEFRQTQTAISSLFIAKEHDYSLAYPTPLLGKPWSIPMEFPLYQWSVAWLSKASGWTLQTTGRAVSVACFYLTLPAIFLLLGNWGLTTARRLLVLTVVLTSPLYIFYTRGFLIESMALGFSAWFLTAVVKGLPDRSWRWLAVAVLCGVGAALVKVTTFLLWSLPAGFYCLCQLWSVRQAPDRRRLFATLAWAATAALPAFLAAFWWVRYSDAIKQLNYDGGKLLVSSHLTHHNFGDWSTRLDPVIWKQLFHQWGTAVMPLWLVAVVFVAALFMRSAHRLAAVAFATFFSALLIFPILYFIHDYYFYAAGLFWLGTAACVLLGLLDGPLPRPVFWILFLTLIAGNLNSYRTGYYVLQQVASSGGSGLTDSVRECTPPGTVLIVAGADWSAVIPYYAQRKALMIRTGLEFDWPSIEHSFDDLKGEEVGALILVGIQRDNHELAARAAKHFHLDPAVTFAHSSADIYLNLDYRQSTLIRLASAHGYEHITPRAAPEVASEKSSGPERRVISPSLATGAFGNVTPAPTSYRFTFGIIPMENNGRAAVGAHPDSELWVPPPANASHITWEFGMLDAAYLKDGDKTDGVEFIIMAEDAKGERRQIYRRVLDPVRVPADRGEQKVEIPYDSRPGETLVFMSRPNGSGAYDWAYWTGINVH